MNPFYLQKNSTGWSYNSTCKGEIVPITPFIRSFVEVTTPFIASKGPIFARIVHVWIPESPLILLPKKSEAGRTGQEDADLLEHAKECHWEEGL